LNKKKLVIVAFVIGAIIVSVEWLWAHATNSYPNHTLLIISWGLFYVSCLFVTIYGSAKSAALEGTVYCLTIFGEAFAPGLSETLISRLPDPDVAHSHALLAVTAHLTLTLAACAIVIGWGFVLIFTRMDEGHTPTLARVYVVLIVIFGIGVIVWGLADPAGFIGLQAAKDGHLIRGLWPSMIASPLSYARIILAILTMFLPWVKATMDGASRT
jgi:hypothetical protein